MNDKPKTERTDLCCSVPTSTKPSPSSSSSSSAENLPSESCSCDGGHEALAFHSTDGRLSSSSDSSSVSEEPCSSTEPSSSPPQQSASSYRDWCLHDNRDARGGHNEVSHDELLELSRILGLKNLKCVRNEGGRNVLIGFD